MNTETGDISTYAQWAESIAALRACIGASVKMMRRDRYYFNGEPDDTDAGSLEVVFDNSHSFTLCLNPDGESAKVSAEALRIQEAFCLDDGSRCEWKEHCLIDHPEWVRFADSVLEGAEAVLERLEDGQEVVIGWRLLLSGGQSIVYFNCGDDSRILVDQLIEESPGEMIEYVSIDNFEKRSSETAPPARDVVQTTSLRKKIMSLRTLILGLGCGLLVLFVVLAACQTPDAETYARLGQNALMQCRWDDALVYFKKAAAIEPEDADAYFGVGYTYGRLKQYQDALAAYKKAIAIDPDLTLAYNNMGITYGNLKQWPDAIAAYKKAIAVAPYFTIAYNNMGNAYGELKQYADAIAAYKKAISIYPEDADAYFGMGYTYENLKQYADAIAAYEEAIAIEPDDAGLYYNMGNAYGSLKQWPEAVAAYKKCIALAPTWVMSDEARRRISKIENRD